MTVPNLTSSLRSALESCTVAAGRVFGEEDYNGDLEDNEDMPEYDDDLTDIDNMRDYVKGKQNDIFNNLHYEQKEEDPPTNSGGQTASE